MAERRRRSPRTTSTDSDDFVLSADPGGPAWHLESVAYEIFPDRFASSRIGVEPPDWAVPRPWDALPEGRGPNTEREWFGGDLDGIRERLDHIERLGANLVYLTPFFPAGSTHRYDAASFDFVDPLLGGDEALAALLAAAHARGIRVVGDLTLNHCGAGHEWFRSARDFPSSVERGLLLFRRVRAARLRLVVRRPLAAEVRLGEPRAAAAPARGRRAALAREGLDGWRIDVANMAGRHGTYDANRAVARATREAVEAERDDALLIAEHGHDFRPDLQAGAGTGR